MQNSGVMLAFPLCTRMACVGQYLMQLIHPVQASSSSCTEWMNLFKLLPPLDKLSETDVHGDGGADSDCRIYIHIIRIFLHIGQSHTGAEAQ